jgi:hypothetical protein
MRWVRRVTVVCGLIGALMLTLFASPANASSWQLIDNQQRTCYVSTRGGTNYYGIWIDGAWSSQISIGASSLPAGGSFYTFYAPIPPGSSDGIGSLAYVAVVLPAGAATGTFTASMFASDGSTTEAVPITLVVQPTSCAHY